MANRGISAGSLRQHVQRRWRGVGPWESSQKRRIVTECAPLHTHPCNGNRHQNWFELQTRASSFQILASSRSIGSNARDMKRGVGSYVHSTRAPDKKDSSAHEKGDKWRTEFMEKQAKLQKKFDNVKPPPPIEREDWWTPDPMTGWYAPESSHGCVTTAPRNMRRTSSGKDQDKAPWFNNMEELPDMDRHKKK